MDSKIEFESFVEAPGGANTAPHQPESFYTVQGEEPKQWSHRLRCNIPSSVPECLNCSPAELFFARTSSLLRLMVACPYGFKCRKQHCTRIHGIWKNIDVRTGDHYLYSRSFVDRAIVAMGSVGADAKDKVDAVQKMNPMYPNPPIETEEANFINKQYLKRNTKSKRVCAKELVCPGLCPDGNNCSLLHFRMRQPILPRMPFNVHYAALIFVFRHKESPYFLSRYHNNNNNGDHKQRTNSAFEGFVNNLRQGPPEAKDGVILSGNSPNQNEEQSNGKEVVVKILSNQAADDEIEIQVKPEEEETDANSAKMGEPCSCPV